MEIEVIASGSSGNCYIIHDGKSNLMIECGITYRQLQERTGYRPLDLSGCIVSHEHMDHARGVGELIRRGVPVWMTAGTKKAALFTFHYGRIQSCQTCARSGSRENLHSIMVGFNR